MNASHWKAVLTIVGSGLGGAIVGSIWTGSLETFFLTITAREHAADWFGAAGTWAVGIIGVFITVQLHKASAAHQEERESRLANENEAIRAQSLADAKSSAQAVLDENTKQWNVYRSLISRVEMAQRVIDMHYKISPHMSAEDALPVVQLIQSAIPDEKMHHMHFLDRDIAGEHVASFETLINHCKAICSKFLRKVKLNIEFYSGFPMQNDERRAFDEIIRTVRSMCGEASQVAKLADAARPAP